MVKKEFKIFMAAVMFLTRLPVPAHPDYDTSYLQKSSKYFPLVGWIVGGISALTFLIFNKYFTSNLAILASIITGVLTTGAFHEDGWADVCDAFGGGWTKEKILLIMKDSRLGTYGTIGLIGILSSKFLLLQEIPSFIPTADAPITNILYNYRYFICIMMAAHSTSRWMCVFIIRFYENVSNIEISKSKPLASQKPSMLNMILSGLFALLPFAFIDWQFLLITPILIYIAFSMANYFKKWIGGYTGDCLGAIQQITECSFYLLCIITWQYFI
jgi:adenosylcobinamide-GDP ribazoletransferase